MVFMTYRRLVFVLVLRLLMGVSALHAQQPSILVKAHLEPADVVNSDAAKLIVEVQSNQPTSNLHLEFSAPPGFQITPSQSVGLPTFQGHYTSTFASVVRSDSPPVGTHSVLVRAVSGAGAGSAAVADATVSFAYISRIPIWSYLLLGAIGIVIGYVLRLLIGTLKTVPAPPLAPQAEGGGGPAVGPITTFVQQHYYFVDCAVTLTVGLLSLTLLLKNNHVPDTGLYWYSTLGSGVALGLLTNSELLSKLR
jgi:hypothetical protein